MTSFNAVHIEALDAVARQRQRQELLGLSAYERHKRFVDGLVKHYGGRLPPQPSELPSGFKSDEETLRETYRFIRTDDDDAESKSSWEVKLAKRYYSRLFREYAIADLSRYKESRVGLRWRTQREVVSGKGQFICGCVGCEEQQELSSYEVPFGYVEAGVKKRALVKVRLCKEHAGQLNYKKHYVGDSAKSDSSGPSKAKRSHNGDEIDGKRRKKVDGGYVETDNSMDGDVEERSLKAKEVARERKDVDADADAEVLQGLFE